MLGRLRGKVAVANYQLLPVDDSKAGDPDIHRQVEAHKQRVAQDVLAPLGLSFDAPVVETAFDVAVDESHLDDSNLGPFIADAIRSGIDRAMSIEAHMAVRVDQPRQDPTLDALALPRRRREADPAIDHPDLVADLLWSDQDRSAQVQPCSHTR